MNVLSILKGLVLSFSCLGLLLPQSAVIAAQPQTDSPGGPQSFRIGDVALGPQDALHGKVVDRQGLGLAGVRVVLAQRDRQVAQTTADAQGHFAIANVPWGVYSVSAAGGIGMYRLWPNRIAPPAANQGVLIVSGGQVTRGQDRMYQWIADNYLLTCTAIAAVVAVPVALIDIKTKKQSSQ